MTSNALENSIAKNMAWIHTFRQPTGFGGPVVHYWGHCLDYIGPANDWRYEGLVTAFLELYSKTKNPYFLECTLECGEFVLQSQKSNGSFANSAFEANPSFTYSGQPHESAVDIALLRIAAQLKKEENLHWKKFAAGAEKNIQQILIDRFWNESHESFQQYEQGRFDAAPDLIVPNKIATACEALLEFAAVCENSKWIKRAARAAQPIVKLQSEDEKTAGGIFQSSERKHIFSYYTARCIPPLLKLFEKTGNNSFLKTAQAAGGFVARLQLPSGAFSCGFDAQSRLRIYPIFVAGSADILRALDQLGGFDEEVKRGIEWLLKQQNPNGGFRSFTGINQKNSDVTHEQAFVEDWEDALGVVGWNDKVLRLLVSQLRVGSQLPTIPLIEPMKIECANGTLVETSHAIEIKNTEKWVFEKQAFFSNPNAGLKNFFYCMGQQRKPVGNVGKMGFRRIARK